MGFYQKRSKITALGSSYVAEENFVHIEGQINASLSIPRRFIHQDADFMSYIRSSLSISLRRWFF